MNLKINLGKISKLFEKRAEIAIKKGLEDFKKAVDDYTPEDTGNLLKNNEISEIINTGGKIIGMVYNNTKYRPYVEYGLGRPFKYHKPKGKVFYIGVGARMFTRAFDENSEKIKNNIINKILYDK